MDILQQFKDLLPEMEESTIPRIITSVAIVLVLWVLQLLIKRLFLRRVTNMRTRYNWNKLITYSFLLIAAIIIGRQWFAGMQSLVTFLGLLTAGVAIALREPLVNLAGWMFLMGRRPFKVGDRIELDGIKGDVIDISAFMFTILEIGNWVQADQSTGRMIYIPNGRVFQSCIANYESGFEFVWNEIPVMVTFESDWKKAKQILNDIVHLHSKDAIYEVEKQLRDASRKFLIYYRNLTPIVYTSVADCGVVLTLRYLCKVRRRRDSADIMWEEILVAFAKCPDIDLAYPTTRFYNNTTEGKPGAQPATPGPPKE
ncbi:MAG: mechanosensitive ion channel family protein [Candidatus Cloacimonetes bacterium]|nr:mechanosensitive ion channel family protein [Candidatus Cloacimonadota bacterium]